MVREPAVPVATPSERTDARTVVPATRSRTKTSGTWLASPDARFVASETNATVRPSSLMLAPVLEPFAWAPLAPRLTRSVVWATLSRTKTSLTPFVSPTTRFDADDVKAT